ncbi:hypothetical protein ABI59_06965 [Acidobacteria bacterium Mor1]|nr:hypothetical protein ABI59_06965 [Acidobacteria bacterium Mor1]
MQLPVRIRPTAAPLTGLLLLLSAIALTLPAAVAQAPVVQDVKVSGPAEGFEMGSRLMTSGKRMKVWLTVPGAGKVAVPKFNGTFFYRHTRPEATSATLMFHTERFENDEGKLAKPLAKALDFRSHPFFAFQSHRSRVEGKDVALEGKLIVKDRETEAVLHLRAPGEVAVNSKDERWLQVQADMEVAAAAVGLEEFGQTLQFELDLFLFNYTQESARKTGVNVSALEHSPPRLPSDPEGLSNAGWYLMYERRFDDAIAAFDKAIAKNPRFVSAYMRRGDAYAFNEQYGMAVGTYRLMWDIMPTHPHLIELRKVLAGEYLTAASLDKSNKQWLATQKR